MSKSAWYLVPFLVIILLLASANSRPIRSLNSAATPGLGATTAATAKPGTALIVSAAADLTPAFQEIGKLFTQQTGVEITFNFGSTGQLSQQIEQGAPVDVFAAADQSYIQGLNKKGLVIPDTVTLYAQGRITIWTRTDSPLMFSSLADLTRDEVKRIAIANPDHAPYGVAAREALQSVGIWDAVQPKLILGENVAQTLQYAETGNVDVAIVALSLSVATGDVGKWVLISAELHRPLNQALAVIKSTKYEVEARQFVAFINSPAGRTIMKKYGFILPGEQPGQATDQPAQAATGVAMQSPTLAATQPPMP